MSVGEYARRFSSLLAYVPHVSGRERAKRNKFLEGLNEELYSLVLVGSPMSYADAMDKAMDIEEVLQNRRSCVRPQWCKVTVPWFRGCNLPSLCSHPSHPSSRQPNSLDTIGLNLVVVSSRRSQVLVLLARAVLAAVVPR
ncbi:hypothetical protein F511_22253 [Dorcoceras hygrometricum]|uniref:Retrotransposon gag domain-containing protein n=1 Tax=Dorcoceras hygrometricum TaxID=472368 RepID=A0A2Z7CP93_9LAMI|nr:hypothetical protein F511_22253 [Dorcoceras hygrometricum]